jgi:4-aminobutyrate aminotransferase-like enzyme
VTVEMPSVSGPLPGPRSAAILSRADRVVMRRPDIGEMPFVEASKRGWLIEDVDGNTFVDHCSAWGSTPLGATPERVQEAVIDAQRRYGMEISNYIVTEPVVALAERLVDLAPPGLDRVSMDVSGTLVVEAGVKLAREATGRPMLLTFYGQYHGEASYLTGAVSSDMASVPSQNAQYVPGVVFAPYPNRFRAPFHAGPGPFDEQMYLDYLEDWILVHQVEPTQIAGVLIEPVLGEGGILTPSQGFWDRLVALCRRWGWKLILDEVQTCMGRCGTMFAAERFGLEPDLLLLGKGFAGGGQPIAAVLGTEEVMGSSDLHLGGTFAWEPAAAAGALENIEAILETGALENARSLEAIALDELGPMVDRVEQVGDVRAAGALIGVEFVQDSRSLRPAPAFHRAVHAAAVRRGVVGITEWGKWVYRLQPAINMDPELFRWSCRALAEAVDEVSQDPPPEIKSLLDLGDPPELDPSA